MGSGTGTTVKKPQRNRHAGWSFNQLRLFLEYKATLAGVTLVQGRSSQYQQDVQRLRPLRKSQSQEPG